MADSLTKDLHLTNQPTALPRGYLWFWCDRCDGNPQCGRCGGGSVFNLTWSMPIFSRKHGVVNLEVV